MRARGSFAGARTGYRLVRAAKHQSVSAMSIHRMRVKNTSDFPDHLVCRTWDGTTEGDTDVLVAKPYLLRRTPFDGHERGGATIVFTSMKTRTLTLDGDTEDQVVIPPYLLNDEINAALGIVDGTGVEHLGEPVRYLDLNVDGREWMKDAG